MTKPHSSIPLQHIQNAAQQANPKFARAMRPYVEEAERREQNRERHALLLVFEELERERARKVAEELTQKDQIIERQAQEIADLKRELSKVRWRQKPM